MALRTNLDLDTLRTLTIAHDRGGLGQAAEYLSRTPSAISLQMKRLQEDLGVPVFRKRGRGLTLTEAGEVALYYARRMLSLNDELLDNLQGAKLAGHIRIGCPQDFAALLPPVLSHFASLYPRMQIELLIDGNASLLEAVRKSRIDLAAIIGHEPDASGQIIGRLEVMWIAASTFRPPKKQPLPLAVLGPKCPFRRAALHHLEAGNVPYRIAASSPSMDGLWAALRGGLGVTARTALNLPEGLASAGALYDLPRLGSLPVALHRNAGTRDVTADRMAVLLSKALEVILQPISRTKALRSTGQGRVASS